MTIPIFKFPKSPAPTPASIWISKVEAIKAFHTATKQGLYESKNSFDASFPKNQQIKLFVLAQWIRAWFVECYKPLPAPRNEPPLKNSNTESNPCGEVELTPTATCTLEVNQYRYRKRCSVCGDIFYDEPIARHAYEATVDNPALRISRESNTWYLTIESKCSKCP